MRLRVIGIALLALVFAATSAEASSIALRVTSGLSSITVYDDVAPDATPGSGVITCATCSVGQWSIVVGTGVGDPANPFPGAMDLNFLVVGSGTTQAALQPITIEFTQYNLSPNWGGYNLDFGGTTTQANVTYSAYWGDAATPFDQSNLIGTLGPFSPSSFSGSMKGPGSSVSPFSLTQIITITPFSTRSSVVASGDASLTPVPEPGSLLLLGGGLAGLAGLARRRMKRAPKA